MSDGLEIPAGDVTSKLVVSRYETISEASIACRTALRECFHLAHLSMDEWPSDILVRFDDWLAQSGALGEGNASLEERLATKEHVSRTILDLLCHLYEFIIKYQEKGKKNELSTMGN